jgi:hypothetical protein
MKVPNKYVEEAAKLSDSVLKEGIIDNFNSKIGRLNFRSPAFIVGIISLVFIGAVAFLVRKRTK